MLFVTSLLGLVLLFLTLLYLQARRGERLAQETRQQLRQEVETAIDRRMKAAGNNAVRSLETHAGSLQGELEEHARALDERLRQALHQEAQSLSECLRTDLASRNDAEVAFLNFDTLAAEERQRLVAAMQAAGRLGDWIEHLLPALETAVDCDLDELPAPAKKEWCAALKTLRRFADRDAVALRGLAVGNGRRRAPEDLPDGEGELPERLRSYLEPFDHAGRLGEAVLALQYLLEAFPVEQLPAEQRSGLRRGIARGLKEAGLGEDFHSLVEVLAAGIGLEYRPVRYYKSRIDSGELAFVRAQVSPISLSERVGFEATAEPTAVVRLERPFFFHRSNSVYYAGHAYVARS
jgi:hypothetical protein